MISLEIVYSYHKNHFEPANIMKEEKIGKIHMVGVSLGAVLAQDFANHYPDMVKSLACFGGSALKFLNSCQSKIPPWLH